MKKYLIILMLIALWSPMAGWALEINGDFNKDKKLTMDDVFLFKDILLDQTRLQFTHSEKDINKDGNIDIADLACLIKMVRNQNEGGGLNVGIGGWEDSGEDWGGTVMAPALQSNLNPLNYQEERQAGFWAVAALPYNESVTVPFRARNHSDDDIIAYKVTVNFRIGERGHPFSFDRFDNGDFIEILNPNENIYYETVLVDENHLTIICFSLDNSSVLKARSEEDLFRIRFKFTYGKHWEETEDERIWGDGDFCGSDFTLFNHPYMDVYIKLKPQETYRINYIVDDNLYAQVDVKPNSSIEPLEMSEKEGYTFSGWEGLPAIMPPYDINIYGHYDVNFYRLTYKIGEETIAEWDVPYGREVPHPYVEERDGYTFNGWVDCPETMPSHDVTVNGSFSVNSYTLRFVIDDEAISEQTVEFGTTIVAPEAPEKEGYTFNGWEGYPETMPSHDMTIWGSYRINSYKLTYVIDGNTIEEFEIEYGAETPEIGAPEREGFTFNGWSERPQTMPASDVTVEGSYTVNTYTLTFKIDEEVFSEEVVEFGSEIVAPETPEKEGYTFNGWEEYPETMPSHDVTVNGSFRNNSYLLTFKIGDEIIFEEECEYGSEINAPEAPEREGYTFNGWSEYPETMPAMDVTVEGSYTVNTYTLIFKIDDEIISEQTVEYGSEIEAPEAPQKEGYTFNGWEEYPERMPSYDVTVNGSYGINSYSLIFKIGDEIISEEDREYGSEINAPEAPEREGYTFTGWSEYPQTMPANDVTVEGSYSVNTYTLIFKIDDEIVSEQTVEYGSEIESPEAPEKEGYTFNGWEEYPERMPSYDVTVNGSYRINSYKLIFKVGDEIISEEDSEYGSEITAPEAPEREGFTFNGWTEYPQTMPANDVTVEGSYSVNTYTLIFKIDDEIISEQQRGYGSEIEAPEAPEKEGYTFNGWEEYPENMPSHDVTVNGSYSVNSYKLSFVIDGNVVEEKEVEYGVTLVQIEAPEKEGYSFSGWSGLPETMPANDVTVTGSYTINSYRLVFKVGNDIIYEAVVEYGSEIVEPAAPEKEGFDFAGWDEHPDTMPAHDLIVNGHYEGNSYKLTYMIDGEVIAVVEVEFAANIDDFNAPEKEGYTFNGWEGIPETMPGHDVTVTGSYSINSYTLIFKIGDELISESVVEYGSNIEEPQAPEKEGHTFSGWDEHPQTMPAKDLVVNGSYSVNSYKLSFVIDGEVISEAEVEFGSNLESIEVPEKEGYSFNGWVGLPETMPAKDVTVTGSYSVNTYTLIFKIGNEVISETVVEYGSNIEEPQAPEKEGFSFSGWDEHPQTMPAHDLTINGHYEGNSYKLTFVIDGEVISEAEVEFGSNLESIEAPEKEGYTFNGWVGLPETMPAKDVNVTGSYSVNTYTLIFKIGNEVISETVVEYGSKIEEPEAPEKEGFDFAGWDEHPATMPAHDLTINGHYEGNSYKLTFVIDGEVISETEVEFEATVEAIEAPEKEGYTFNGWVGLPETMPSHDVTVTGSYTVNSYTLKFVADGKVISEQTIEYGAEIIAPEDPEKEGYTFNGWEAYPETMPADNLTINGFYSINSYILTYVIDGEIFDEEELEYGAQISEIGAPEKEGYTFNEWVGMPETMPAHDVTVNASYTVNTYTITFITEWNVVSELTLEYGAEIIAPEAPEIEGYTFIMWDEYPETMPAEDLVVYGNYIVNVYTVTYIIDDEVIRVDEVEYGAELPDAPEAPEKEDYDFVGWSEIPETMPAYDITIYGSYEYNAGLNSILQDSVKVDIFDIQGRLIKKDVDPERISDYVPSGVYIINHTKVLIK